MTLIDLTEGVGMTFANISILKTGKARAVRFSTLDAICQALHANQETSSGTIRHKQLARSG